MSLFSSQTQALEKIRCAAYIDEHKYGNMLAPHLYQRKQCARMILKTDEREEGYKILIEYFEYHNTMIKQILGL